MWVFSIALFIIEKYGKLLTSLPIATEWNSKKLVKRKQFHFYKNRVTFKSYSQPYKGCSRTMCFIFCQMCKIRQRKGPIKVHRTELIHLIWMPVRVLTAPLLIHLPTNGLGKQQWLAHVLGTLHPPGRPAGSSCLRAAGGLAVVAIAPHSQMEDLSLLFLFSVILTSVK